MTVDSELRKIWRRDLAQLKARVDDLVQQVARLRLELEPYLPKKVDLSGLPPPTEVVLTPPP